MPTATHKANAKTPASQPMVGSYFAKMMLRPGDYLSPDGVLTVTPKRLKGWADSHKKMSSAGYYVPSKFDHGKKKKDLTPMAKDVFKTSKNTVGRLAEFNLVGNGEHGAEIVMEITDPVAIGRCQRNEVEVSPVILSQFSGGDGLNLTDIIGHVDLVDYGVDRSQTKFVEKPSSQGAGAVLACSVIRMSSTKSVFRLSSDEDDSEDDDSSDKMKGGDLSTGGEDDADESKDGDGDGKVKEGKDSEEDQDSEEENAEERTEESDEADDTKLANVMALLRLHDIVLGEDTDRENFFDRVESALETSAKKDGLEKEDADNAAVDGEGGGMTTIADPGYMAMSSLKRFAEKSYANDIASRLNRLVKTGRCTPAEFTAKAKEKGSIRLSVLSDGSPKSNSLTLWLESREALRENSAFDATKAANKSQLRMSSAPAGESVAQPGIPEGDPGVMTRQQQIELGNRIAAGAY